MKNKSGIWVVYLLVVVGTALIVMMLFNSACTISGSAGTLPLIPDTGDTDMNMMVVAEAARSTRKLLLLQGKEEEEEEGKGEEEVLEDYRPIDPVPSSKASVKPGPIEHGTPLNPFIPRSPPPSSSSSSTHPPSPF